MPTMDNEKIARALYQAFNDRDFERTRAFVSDRVRWRDMATGVTFDGPSGYQSWQEAWLTAFPDGKIEIDRMLVSGDRVAVEYTGRGTQTGPLPGLTGMIAPTRNRIEHHFCDVIQLKDGKVTDGRTYYDVASLISDLNRNRMAA